MAAHQPLPSLGFSRQEHWSGLPFPSPMHESEKWKWCHSVVSDSSQPHGLQPTRLLRPWDFPGKSTGVGCHCLLLNCMYFRHNSLINAIYHMPINAFMSKLLNVTLSHGYQFSTFMRRHWMVNSGGDNNVCCSLHDNSKWPVKTAHNAALRILRSFLIVEIMLIYKGYKSRLLS